MAVIMYITLSDILNRQWITKNNNNSFLKEQK